MKSSIYFRYPFWSLGNASRLTIACKVIVALDVVYEMFMISCYNYNAGGSVFLSLSQFAWGISDDMRQTELVGNMYNAVDGVRTQLNRSFE